MKYLPPLSFVLLAVVLLGSPAVTQANDLLRADVRANVEVRAEDREAAMQERREALNARLGEIKARVATRTDEVKARIADHLKANAELITGRIFAHITASLDRIDTFDAHVETRLDELAAANVDVTASRSELSKAQAVHASAEANILDLKADLKAELDGETTRSELMAILKAAREEVASVRKAYADVLLQIRVDVKASKGE